MFGDSREDVPGVLAEAAEEVERRQKAPLGPHAPCYLLIHNLPRFRDLRRAAGYRSVAAVTAAADVTDAVDRALAGDGPHFVLVKVTAEQAEAPRIPYSPHELRDRFRTSTSAVVR